MENRWRRREEIGYSHFKQKEIISQAQVSYVHCIDWKKAEKGSDIWDEHQCVIFVN